MSTALLDRSRPRVATVKNGLRVAALVLVTTSGGCVLGPTAPPPEPVVTAPVGPNPQAPRLAALESRHYELASADEEVVGQTQVLFARYENTFSAIGREYNLGYEELRSANPGIDQWLPGEGTPIYLPTATILPDAPRRGIVINVPAMRLYFFSTETDPADKTRKVERVTTHPIGVGAEGWATPIGEAKVTGKARDPVWYVPASVRKEHAERGDRLPSVVKPGPDNPLGRFALTLSIPSYLIHGTNKPAGVGMRSSHGCIRLYPEDIEELFGRVSKGTPVRLVNQPVLAGWRDGQLYLEVHPPLVEETRDLGAEAERLLTKALERRPPGSAVAIDRAAVARIVAERRGIPLPVLASDSARSLAQYLAAARIVENTVPITTPEQTAEAHALALPATPIDATAREP
jgi:L,D-transpeptidase ErfK/SrfK